MKAVKLGLVIMAVALFTIGVSGMANAFHRGGVAECAGCHSMHSPLGTRLLIGSDASSACLSCHEHAGDTGPSSYHVSTAPADMPALTPPLQRGPGGDFGWLKKSYAWTAHGEAEAETGPSHGHSIVALDKGYDADPVNTISPGGSFAGSALGCQSCHDPHGKGRRDSTGAYSNTGAPIFTTGSTGTIPTAGLAVGTYRILAGTYYNPGSGPFGGWPIAVAPSTYNRTEATQQIRIAYGGGGSANGWGKWCGTCHNAIATGAGLAGHPSHPVDGTLSSTIVTNYNTYVKSGDMTGTQATAYTSLIPFQEGTSAIATLVTHAKSDNTYLIGASTSDEVTCLTCHRAHASGWKHALRWNPDASFIVSNGVYPAPADNSGHTPAEAQAAYYDRPPTVFAAYQRSLCNKCHAKD